MVWCLCTVCVNVGMFGQFALEVVKVKKLNFLKPLLRTYSCLCNDSIHHLLRSHQMSSLDDV